MEDVQRYDEETGTYVTKMGLKLAARKQPSVSEV